MHFVTQSLAYKNNAFHFTVYQRMRKKLTYLINHIFRTECFGQTSYLESLVPREKLKQMVCLGYSI
jgi:hypothetical protein